MDERVIVVIPAYNEEQTIASVLIRLRQAAPEFDRVVVVDGSKDATGKVVAEMGEKQINLPVNLGYGLALQTGLKYALHKGYDIVVSMDADGQHRPEDVPRLVNALRETGADMVIGSRYCDGSANNAPVERRLGQLLFSYLTRLLMGRRIYDTSSGFKAYDPAVLKVVVNANFLDFHTESIIQLNLLRFRIVEVPVSMAERAHGNSMHSLASIVHYPLKTLLLTIVAFMDALVMRKTR